MDIYTLALKIFKNAKIDLVKLTECAKEPLVCFSFTIASSSQEWCLFDPEQEWLKWKWWLCWIPPEHDGILATGLPKPLIYSVCHTGWVFTTCGQSRCVRYNVNDCQSPSVKKLNGQRNGLIDGDRSRSWGKKLSVCLSTLHVLI